MSIQNGKFTESNIMWPGQNVSLDVVQTLYSAKSKYQDILVFESAQHGIVLALDGVIQVTERDEFAYQETIAHIPMFSHPNPKHILVIGGGDGGVLRELVKHPSVEQITLCEIDGDVIEVSKKYLPSLSIGFSNPKVTVFVGDGVAYLKEHKGCYDVVITDSSDPVGPAKELFEKNFFMLLKESLKEGGIVCCQGESVWLHLDIIEQVNTDLSSIFSNVGYAMASVPTYPSGVIGFFLATNDKNVDFKTPTRLCMDEMRYYDSEVHSAAFVLPRFVKRALKMI